LHAEGKAKSIGVSNFTVSHLRQLLPRCIVRPSVNQVELHPLCPQRELIAYCNGEKIHVQAYSSLGQETGKLVLMTHPIVVAIAERVRRTPAQVLLRYGVQQGISVIPKSSSRAHLAENASIFDFALTDDEMMSLHNMCDGKPQHFCWYASRLFFRLDDA
jgi:diketogulonate reductase-like aldo/keto reductase